MGTVIHLPKPKAEERAATCGCGGQTFILVVGPHDQPDFVYCTECQLRQTLIAWAWVP